MYVLILWQYREQRPSWRDGIEQPEAALDQGPSLAPLSNYAAPTGRAGTA